MYYILINRSNAVVDVLDYKPRYIKLQPNSGFVIGCAENEGMGVIGSDCNTHYPLTKSDSQSNPDAVDVIEVEEVPSEIYCTYTVVENRGIEGEEPFEHEVRKVIPKLFKYENGEFSYVHTLDEAKDLKQEENKARLAEYLANHPLTWVDGKQYGITEEDQSEITRNLNQYQLAVSAGIASPTLEWHAIHEECRPWDAETLVALGLDITKAVYPAYHKMQKYKTEIYACGDHESLAAIELDYEA